MKKGYYIIAGLTILAVFGIMFYFSNENMFNTQSLSLNFRANGESGFDENGEPLPEPDYTFTKEPLSSNKFDHLKFIREESHINCPDGLCWLVWETCNLKDLNQDKKELSYIATDTSQKYDKSSDVLDVRYEYVSETKQVEEIVKVDCHKENETKNTLVCRDEKIYHTEETYKDILPSDLVNLSQNGCIKFKQYIKIPSETEVDIIPKLYDFVYPEYQVITSFTSTSNWALDGANTNPLDLTLVNSTVLVDDILYISNGNGTVYTYGALNGTFKGIKAGDTTVRGIVNFYNTASTDRKIIYYRLTSVNCYRANLYTLATEDSFACTGSNYMSKDKNSTEENSWFSVDRATSRIFFGKEATSEFDNYDLTGVVTDGDLVGICGYNSTHIAIINNGTKQVVLLNNSKSDTNLNPANLNFSLSADNQNPFGLECNSSHFWVIDNADQKVYIYTEQMTYPPVINTLYMTANNSYNDTNADWTGVWTGSDPDGNRLFNTTWFNTTRKEALLIYDFNVANATDLSGRGYNGVVSGATWNSTGGKDGSGSYKFDGINDKIDTSINRFNFSGNYTISFWFKSENNLTEQSLFGKGHTNLYWSELNVKLLGKQLFLIIGNGTNGYSLNDGSNLDYPFLEYNFVTITGNGTKLTLYKNGIFDKTFIPSVYLYNTTTKLMFGVRGNVSSVYFNGSIDSVQIYNYSLSAQQILNIYNNASHVLDSSETETYDNWTFNVVASDVTYYSSRNKTDFTILETPNTEAYVVDNFLNTSTANLKNYTSDNILNYIRLMDNASDSILYYVYLWNGTDTYFGLSADGNVTNNTLTYVLSLASANTKKWDNWTFGVTPSDKHTNGTANNVTIMILNSPTNLTSASYDITNNQTYTYATNKFNITAKDSDIADGYNGTCINYINGTLNDTLVSYSTTVSYRTCGFVTHYLPFGNYNVTMYITEGENTSRMDWLITSDSNLPAVLDLAPADNTINYTTTQPYFFYTPRSNVSLLLNTTLYINDEINATNFYVANNTATSIQINSSFAYGDYNWIIQVADQWGRTNSTARNISIDLAQSFSNTTIKPDPAYFNSTVYCNATYLNNASFLANITLQMYYNDTLNFTNNFLNVASGTTINSSILDEFLFRGDTYFCAFNSTDIAGTIYQNTSTLTISNSVPNGTISFSPANNTLVTTVAELYCGGLIDPDRDEFNYVFMGSNSTTDPPDYVLQNSTSNYFNWSAFNPGQEYLWTCFGEDSGSAGGNAGILSLFTASFTNCTESNATHLLLMNLTIKDEATNNEITNDTSPYTNITMKVDIFLYTINSSIYYLNYTNKFYNETSVGICISRNGLDNSTHKINSTIQYQSTSRVNEFYNIQEHILSNLKALPLMIDLLDLKSDDSTSFLMSFQDSAGRDVDSALIEVWRKYVGEGIFRLVELPITNIDGETVAHLVTEDVIYKFIVKLKGATMLSTSEYLAICTVSPCKIELQEGVTTSGYPKDWNRMVNGEYDFSFDSSTKTATLDYTVNSGTSTMNLSIYQLTNNGTDKIVRSGQQTAAGGTITLIIPPTFSNQTYYATITQDGTLIVSRWVDAREDLSDTLGYTGLILAGVIVMAITLCSISTGALAIIFAIIGMILASTLYIFNMSWSATILILTAGFMIIYKLSRRQP